jgi:hypothetical protein
MPATRGIISTSHHMFARNRGGVSPGNLKPGSRLNHPDFILLPDAQGNLEVAAKEEKTGSPRCLPHLLPSLR